MQKMSTRELAFLGVFTALATVFNIFSIEVVPRVAYLAFTFIPVFIVGIVYGPISGAVVGFMADLIGAIIAPKGAYLPLIGLASALMGFIPGIVFHYTKFDSIVKLAISMVLTLIICTAGLNTYALFVAYSLKDGNYSAFWAYLWARLPWQAANSAINFGLLIVILKTKILDRLLLPVRKTAEENSEE